jgi:hypothetical protein
MGSDDCYKQRSQNQGQPSREADVNTMGGRKHESKTRFVCHLPNQMSELFWVKEQASGGLQLVIKRAINYRADEYIPQDTEKKSQKYSIHRSNGGVDTTIHHTIELANGRKLDSCAFLRDSATTLIWPLFVKACPDISRERYKTNARGSDIVVEVANMVLPVTLIYAVVVSSVNADLRLDGAPAIVSSVNFTYFKISVVALQLLLPSLPHGLLAHVSTNTIRVDKEHVGGNVSGVLPCEPLTRDELIRKSTTTIDEMRRKQIASARKELLGNPTALAKLDLLPLDGFAPFPPRT